MDYFHHFLRTIPGVLIEDYNSGKLLKLKKKGKRGNDIDNSFKVGKTGGADENVNCAKKAGSCTLARSGFLGQAPIRVKALL